MATIRFFGSDNCELCQAYKKIFDENNVKYAYINALDYDNNVIQDLCDDNNVVGLPHIQILSSNGKVIIEFCDINDESFAKPVIKYLNELNS